LGSRSPLSRNARVLSSARARHRTRAVAWHSPHHGVLQNALHVTVTAVRNAIGSGSFWLSLRDKRRVLANSQGWVDAVFQLMPGVTVKVRGFALHACCALVAHLL
jgi:hypothetical protein